MNDHLKALLYMFGSLVFIAALLGVAYGAVILLIVLPPGFRYAFVLLVSIAMLYFSALHGVRQERGR